MRHRRWLEFLKDYYFGLNYHLGKANVVAYALNRKCLHMAALMVRELNLIEQFKYLSLVCEVTANSVTLGMLKLTSGFLDKIRKSQKLDVTLVGCDHRVNENGILKFQDRVCVPDVLELKKIILEESH